MAFTILCGALFDTHASGTYHRAFRPVLVWQGYAPDVLQTDTKDKRKGLTRIIHNKG